MGWPGSWQECHYLSISTCHSLRLLYPNLTSDLQSEWHSIVPCSSLPCNLIISAGSLCHSKPHCSLAWGLQQCYLKLACLYHCPHISSWFQHNALPWGAWRKSQVSCMGIKEAGAERCAGCSPLFQKARLNPQDLPSWEFFLGDSPPSPLDPGFLLNLINNGVIICLLLMRVDWLE